MLINAEDLDSTYRKLDYRPVLLSHLHVRLLVWFPDPGHGRVRLVLVRFGERLVDGAHAVYADGRGIDTRPGCRNKTRQS